MKATLSPWLQGGDPQPVREFGSWTADLHRMAEWLQGCGLKMVVMQSTGVYWIAVYEVLEKAGFEVWLTNARETKNLPGRKALLLSLALSICLFVGMPFWFFTWKDTFKQSFLLAGIVMILLSVVFLLFALEFYDSASGWRGKKGLHFHLAGIASNSFILGVSLAFTGSALTVCAVNFVTGQVLVVGTLLVLVTMTEIERALWDLEKKDMKE